MICPKCGAPNTDNTWKCVQCGHELRAAVSPTGAPVTIPNYLVHSILCTLFCCLPLGIAAIVYAAQVNSKVAAGDIAGAREASDKAKMFCWLSFGLGLVFGLLYFVLTFLGAISQG